MATGVVVSVNPARRGDTLMAATLATDDVLTVKTVIAFGDEDGGWVKIGDAGPFEYLSADEDTNTITLAAAVGAVYEAGLDVNLFDPTVSGGGRDVVEYVASVRPSSGGVPFPAIIDHTTIPLSDTDLLVGAMVEVEQSSDEAWHVARIVAREPRVNFEAIKHIPMFGMKLTANVAIPSATYTPIASWVLDVYDLSAFAFDAVTGRLMVLKTGTYLLIGTVSWANNTSGRRMTKLQSHVFGLDIEEVELPAGPTDNGRCTQVLSYMAPAFKGTSFDLSVYQNSGAALDVRGNADGSLTRWRVLRLQ